MNTCMFTCLTKAPPLFSVIPCALLQIPMCFAPLWRDLVKLHWTSQTQSTLIPTILKAPKATDTDWPLSRLLVGFGDLQKVQGPCWCTLGTGGGRAARPRSPLPQTILTSAIPRAPSSLPHNRTVLTWVPCTRSSQHPALAQRHPTLTRLTQRVLELGLGLLEWK